ncbi:MULTISPECIES: hypothetical protein [Bifidobacterium]|uniref:hypothetical protein n=1 Tax=Bifidobacterium TaxID=1678 RepID=UPI001BDDAE73|nr:MULTISPECIES: hypothetical protein [Bifidobacterium]MBT1162656.1 hypothetical protein [Bifidobacterium sp. SO1]MBW3077943.1 hypothetical protein [Bifidobacterium simiiventris]
MSSEDRSNNNASPDATNKWFQADAFMHIVNSVVVMILAGICCLIAALPLVIVMLVVNDLNYWPLYFAAAGLSSPAVAALYAMFRDHPALLARGSRVRVKRMLEAEVARADGGHPDGEVAAFPPDWIAGLYVRQDVAVAMFRPYFRAYARLFPRALAAGASCALVGFALVYNIALFTQFPWGVYVTPALAVCLVFLFAAFSIAMVLIVEYPKARYLSVMRNAVTLCIRRAYILFITAVALVAYGYGLFHWTLLMMVFGTGVLWYLIWGASRWQAQRLFTQMAAESGDPRIVEMYEVAPAGSGSAGSGISGFFSGTTDWRQ